MIKSAKHNEGLRNRRRSSASASLADKRRYSAGGAAAEISPGVPSVKPPHTASVPASRMVPASALDRYYRRAVAYTCLYWILLVATVLYFSPVESFRRQESSVASMALGAASVVMGASVMTRSLSLLAGSMFSAANGGGGSNGISGAALVGFLAQAVSCAMNGAMAFYPTPAFRDPVTGMTVYLLRWCEWSPLAFIMAFLTASIDAEDQDEGEDTKSKGRSLRLAMRFALCQGVSTTLGLILPVLPSAPAWWATFALAGLLHLTLHPLLVQKSLNALTVSDSTYNIVRGEANASERTNRIFVAGHLIQLLTVAWSLLVVMYVVAWFLQVSSTTNAVLECTVDVISKHFYLNYLIEAHHLIFAGMRSSDEEAAEAKSLYCPPIGGTTAGADDHSADTIATSNTAVMTTMNGGTTMTNGGTHAAEMANGSHASHASTTRAAAAANGSRASAAPRSGRTSAAPPPAQRQQVALLFQRAKNGDLVAVLTPAEMSSDATLIEAARHAGAMEGKAQQEGARDIIFRTTLKDGTEVPLTTEQAERMALSEIVAIRGIKDAPFFSVAKTANEDGQKN